MANKKNTNKQNIVRNKKNTENKRKYLFIGFICSIILLVFVLIIVLNLNSKSKSEARSVMNSFYKYYESKEPKIIFYYDSKEDDVTSAYEMEYLIRISKDYDIEYLNIDKSKLSEKKCEEIELKLGIESSSPVIAVVKNKLVVAVQNGFIESNKLVDFLISANILDKDSKYIPTNNLKFINYSDYKKLLSDEKDHILIIGESGCLYCKEAKPILNNISKAYKVTINYLDVTDLSSDDLKELFEKLPELGYDNDKLKDEGVFGMPTILIIKKGKIESYLESLHTLEEYISFFEKNNVIE